MAEDIIVLEPGDERAQKIGKAISSQTASDILHILRDNPKTASDLTDLLKIPMSTLKYHLDNLLDAGLLEVRETRYSVKGREIKVYGVRDQLLIVAPKMTNIRSILLKYGSLFAVVILASLVMFALVPLFQAAPAAGPFPMMKSDGEATGGTLLATPPPTALLTPAPTTQAASQVTGTRGTVPETTWTGGGGGSEAVSGPPGSSVQYASAPEEYDYIAVLAFFAGGCLVLLVLVGYEVYRWRKDRAG